MRNESQVEDKGISVDDFELAAEENCELFVEWALVAVLGGELFFDSGFHSGELWRVWRLKRSRVGYGDSIGRQLNDIISWVEVGRDWDFCSLHGRD